MSNSRVTVLMPVHNGEAYLREAIDSILAQTYRDFELLILNDGSTDRSVKIIESYADPRIRLEHNETNLKLIATLNRGLSLAGGEYIAIMHADDISLPERLARQVAFLDARPEIGLAGSGFEVFGDIPRNRPHLWYRPNRIAAETLFTCPLAHPAVTLRREAIERHRLQYTQPHLHAEDWAMWSEACLDFPIANVPGVLLHYRVNSNSVSVKYRETLVQTERIITQNNLSRLSIEATPDEISFHRLLAEMRPAPADDLLVRAADWLSRLERANRERQVYPTAEFAEALGMRWYSACKAGRSRVAKWRSFWTEPAWAAAFLRGMIQEKLWLARNRA